MRAVRRGALAAVAAVGWIVLSAPMAAAQVEGPCAATFNGVDVERIDTIASPLQLGAEDTLVFGGRDDEGTRSATVEVAIMMLPIDSARVVYEPAASEFRADLDLGAMSPYAVGLFRVRGTTDHCTAEVWVRVSGRMPLTTLVGLAAAGLAVGGVTAVIVAIATRRRLSPLTAALGGIAAGVGGAMLGQAFGRLQLSYISLGLTAGPAALAAFSAAWFLRARSKSADVPDDTRPFHDRRDPVPAQGSNGEQATAEPTATLPAIHQDAVEATAEEPSADGGPYWCYVMAPTDVLDLDDHETVVGSVTPGRWYLAKREVGGWAHVMVSEELEGWVSQASVHRHG